MARAKAKKAEPRQKKKSKSAAKTAKKPKAVAKKKPAAPAKAKKPKKSDRAGKAAGKAAAKAVRKSVSKPRPKPAKAAKKPAPGKATAKKAPHSAAKKPGAKIAPKAVTSKKPVEKTPKAAAPKKAAGGKAPAEPPKKKVGLAEVKAAAVRASRKASKRGRKRQRVQPTSTPLANWIPKDGLRPSSFLPAPARAQSAFTVAAAPASSDRLVRDEDLKPPAPIRTIPVLVHVVQEGGRIEVRTNPSTIEVAPGDAVEWDFRYSGGADVLVTQVAIEIARPSPFGKTSYRSTKPGSARPHRHVSEIVKEKALGSTTTYTVHCTNAFKTELAHGSASIVVRETEPNDVVH